MFGIEDYENFSEEVPKIINDGITGVRYSRGEFLGSGNIGNFYLFTHVKTKEKCVGKVIMKNKLDGNLDEIYRETSIQMNLKHSNILRMFRYFGCPTCICMTLELWDDTLECVLKRLKVLNEDSCRFVAREVACGISYLHEQRIIHRGIKPENIFLTKDMDIKIGNFGNATYHRDSTERVMKPYGALMYFAPEYLDGSKYSFGVDVWALGITLYEMIIGHVPFDDLFYFMIWNKIKRCDYIIPSVVPVHTEGMIRTLLTRDPNNRPTIDYILTYDYLNSESISKEHLRGYISGQSFSNTTSQEDPHEFNIISHTRNKNIPMKDCKLGPSRKIEDIFQKEFNIDSNYGNKNVLPKKGEFNIEEQSNYLLKYLHNTVSTLVGSSTLNKVLSPFQIADALTSSNRSKYSVSMWMNLSEDYGLAYQLCDSSVGVLYRDNTRLIVDDSMKNFQYIDERSVREYFEYDRCPNELDKKLKSLGHIKNYMETDSLPNRPVKEKEIGIVDGGIPVLLKWKKDSESICFLLSNGVLQINFFDNHTKIIVSASTESISIIGENNRLKTYSIKKLSLIGLDKVMKKRVLYIMKVIEGWISLKRKHEGDNNDVVPAKKSNNYV
uniref:Polo kinase n=1 Tax=Strongyloides venezuelensis TaxID=75913 RepID=A0A0K0FV71_STRVS